MPVPYRKRPASSAPAYAAFVSATVPNEGGTIFGGLLVIDGRGQPIEFVHNSIQTPTGFLWPRDTVRSSAMTALIISLFDACATEPALLFCDAAVGTAEFIRSHLSPTIACAVPQPGNGELPPDCAWVRDAPTGGSAAAFLFEDLRNGGYLLEPFERVRKGLAEVYPAAGIE